MTYRILLALLVLVATLFVAAPVQGQSSGAPGAVYAMTNASSGNEIVVYHRSADGLLTLAGFFATGGLGKTIEPDDALGAQNPLILSPDNRWLFAVNAGSNTISVFQVGPSGLALLQVIASGGDFPVSLTMNRNLLYVLNAGGDGNVTGFTVAANGLLSPLAGSTRSLNAGGTNPPFFLVSPAQVGFSPAGKWLAVTVKGIHPVHQIHIFAVDGSGLPSAQPVTRVAANTLSFGFVFDGNDRLVVTEPFGNSFNGVPGPGLSAASSYRIAADGSLSPISSSVTNFQTATCWIAITNNTRFAYTTNNASATISSYKVAGDGSLALLSAVAAVTGRGPVDLAISPGGRHLYNVNAGDGTVSMYQIDQGSGALILLGEIGGLPADGSAVGIAVR
ncbi:MAG: beta-propeller fold lactonase family protein [Caldilineaceae bacterium]|nr:beta-propeller fold lactonase family protein [Caldilineaceae bacterium]